MVNSISRRYTASARDSFVLCAVFRRGSEGLLPVWFLLALTGFCCAVFCFLPWSPNTLHIVFIAVAAATGVVCAILHEVLTRLGRRAGLSQPHAPDRRHEAYRIPNDHNDAHPRAPLSEFEGDGRVSSPCLSSLRHVLPAVELIGLGMLMLFSSRVMPSGMSENNVIVSTGQGNCEFPSIVAWKVVVLHLWFLFAMNMPLLVDLCVGIVHYSVLIAQYQCVSIVTFIIAAQWVVVPMLCIIILFVRRGCFRVSCPHGNGEGAGDAFQNDFLSPKGADKQRLNRPQTFETQLTPAVTMDLQCHDSSEDIPCLVLSNGGTIVAEVSHHFATLVGLSPSDVAGCRLAALLDDLRVEKPERFLRIISAIARGVPDELDSDSEDDKGSQVCDDSHVLSPFAVRVALPSDEDAGDYSTVLGRRPSPARMGGIARRFFFRGHAVPASPPLPNAWPSHNNGPPTWPFCVTLDAWSRLDGLVVLRQPRLHAVLDRMQWPAVLVHPRSGRVLYWSPAAAQLTGNCTTDVTGWPMRVSAKDGTQCGKVALEAWMHLPGAAAPRLISIEPLMGEFVEEESAALERSVACLTWPPRHFLWNNQNNKNRRLPNRGGSGNDACGGRSIGGENSVNVRDIDNEAHDRERSPRELPLPANCAPMSANSPDAFGVKGHREAQWYFAPIAHGRGDAHAWATGGVPLLCMLREETAPITQMSDHLSHPSCTNQQEQEERFAHALDDVTRECRAALRAALDHGGSKEELNEITERAERAVMALERYQRGRREKHMDSSGEEDGAQTKRPAGPGLTPTTQSAKTSQHNSSRPSPLVDGTVQRNQTNAREQKKAHSSAGAAGAGTAVAVKDEDDDPKEDNPKGSRGSAVERSEARDKSKSQKSVLVQQNRPPLSRMRSRVRARGGRLSKRSPRMGRSSSSHKTFAPRLVSPLLVEKPISETAARTATAEVELVDATDIGGHPPQKFLQLSSTVATPSLVHSTAASELIPSPTNNNIIVPSNNNKNNNNNDKNNNINNNDVNNRNDDEEPAWAMLRSSDEATIASCYIRVRPGEVFYFGRSSKCHATTTDALVSSIQFAIVRQKQQLQQHQRALTSNDMSVLSTSCDPQRNGPVGGWTITLHDHSANGTFVNVKKVGKGKSSVLRDHDLVTFRLSSSRFFLGFHFILLDERGLPVRDIASPTLSQLGSGLMSRRGTPHTNHNHHPQQQHHGTYHNSSMENGSFVGSSRVSGTPIYKNHNGSSRRPGTTPSRSSRVGGSASHHRETIEWKIGEEMLGKGGNAEVYLGINLTNGKLIAVKRVLLPTCGEGESNRAVLQQYRSLQEEINVLSKAVHPNIVQYYGSSQNQTYFNILLEFVPGGSLRHLLDNFGGLSAGVIFLYLRQTLEGLRYLHQHNIVHSDVKAANILITDKGRVKLSDFGTAKLLGHRQHSQSVDRSGKPAAVSAPATSAGGELGAGSHCTYRVAGTLRWMAPELIRDESSVGPTRASDIWSVGCTLVEMLSSNAPWWEYDFESEEQIINLLKYTTEPPEIPECEECPDLYDIAARCLTLDPATRPSCEELLQMVIDAAECFQARESLPPSTLREGSAAVPRIATSVDASPIQKQQEEQQQ